MLPRERAYQANNLITLDLLHNDLSLAKSDLFWLAPICRQTIPYELTLHIEVYQLPPKCVLLVGSMYSFDFKASNFYHINFTVQYSTT